FTSTAVTAAQTGTPYSYTPTATGTPTPTISASGLPAWLTWDGTTLSGTPAVGDIGTTGNITLTASNGVSPDATQVFQITVSGIAPSFTSTAVTSVQAGSAYSYTPAAAGTPAPTITASGLPAWLTWDGITLSGTPGGGDVGTTGDITLTASNGVSPDATQVFQIAISAAPSPPPPSDDGGCTPGGSPAAWPLGLLALALLLRQRRL
ncbi:MAG: putative Ig domain-containing protein, partial [Planctomycetota bacterium]